MKIYYKVNDHIFRIIRVLLNSILGTTTVRIIVNILFFNLLFNMYRSVNIQETTDRDMLKYLKIIYSTLDYIKIIYSTG